jgi:hypothetical protein
MHVPVEVRQVMLARPVANLVLLAVRAAVAVGASAVEFLQELLVLALEVLFEDNAANLEPVVFVAEPDLLLAVGRVEVRVVLDLALTADASVERLRGSVLAIH